MHSFRYSIFATVYENRGSCVDSTRDGSDHQDGFFSKLDSLGEGIIVGIPIVK